MDTSPELDQVLEQMGIKAAKQSDPMKDQEFVLFPIELRTERPDQGTDPMAINSPDPYPRIFIRLTQNEYQKYNAATNRDLLKELFKTRIKDGYALKRSDRKQVHVYIRKDQAQDADGQTWDFDQKQGTWRKGAIIV
jgi:hypothetical protein